MLVGLGLPTDDNNDAGSSTGGSTDNSGSSTGGSTDNSGSSTGGSTDNSGSSTGGSTDNSGSSTGGSTDNSGSSTGGSTDTSATLPNTSTASNNTGNAADFVDTILGIHNRERVAVGVPPLTWSDSLAASAQNWARTYGDNQSNGPLGRLFIWREHCWVEPWEFSSREPGYVDQDGRELGRRKEELAGRRIDRGECGFGRSLHADGVEGHETGRLWCGGGQCQ